MLEIAQTAVISFVEVEDIADAGRPADEQYRSLWPAVT
jgi:hypothetical protein